MARRATRRVDQRAVFQATRATTPQAAPRSRPVRGMLNPASETEAHSVQMEARSFPSAAEEEQLGQQVFMKSPGECNDNSLTIVAKIRPPVNHERLDPRLQNQVPEPIKTKYLQFRTLGSRPEGSADPCLDRTPEEDGARHGAHWNSLSSCTGQAVSDAGNGTSPGRTWP